MKKHFLFVFLLTVSACFTLGAEERIGGNLEQVDFFIEDMINDEGHNYGERYTVLNKNSVPMRVSIELTDGDNAESHLIEHTVIVNPRKKVDLGYILQKDLAKGATWNYEWQTRPD